MRQPDARPPDGAPEDEERGPIGIFPSWGAVYAAVVITTLAIVLLLYWFTVALDHSRP